jgi:hypothetical protein
MHDLYRFHFEPVHCSDEPQEFRHDPQAIRSARLVFQDARELSNFARELVGLQHEPDCSPLFYMPDDPQYDYSYRVVANMDRPSNRFPCLEDHVAAPSQYYRFAHNSSSGQLSPVLQVQIDARNVQNELPCGDLPADIVRHIAEYTTHEQFQYRIFEGRHVHESQWFAGAARETVQQMADDHADRFLKPWERRPPVHWEFHTHLAPPPPKVTGNKAKKSKQPYQKTDHDFAKRAEQRQGRNPFKRNGGRR